MYQQGQPAIKKDTWLILVTAASLVIAIASLLLVARTRAELRQGITTHALVLITPEGRMRLGVLPGNAVGLRIYSPAGRERLGLGVTPKKNAGFSVYDANGRQRFHLTFSDKSGRSEFKVVQ
ncbi:MAG TPA: hypothetical protein VK881_08305 [bacterium]|nr:hypothetical protein [bacterium]